MSTTTQEPRTDPMRRLYRTRWFMPAFALFLGVLIAGAYWIGDQPGLGAEAFGVMVVMAAIFWFGDGSPYTQLGAFAGVAYLLAVVFLRWRS